MYFNTGSLFYTEKCTFFSFTQNTLKKWVGFFDAASTSECHMLWIMKYRWPWNQLPARSVFITKFIKIVQNEILRVQCTNHSTLIPFYKLTGRFKSEHCPNARECSKLTDFWALHSFNFCPWYFQVGQDLWIKTAVLLIHIYT